ncbi:MAG: hypothetical protein QOE47_624 [Pyrinomonadaceae bacterium]|nr:hypothetical protein [Pyrinomonadaceae bacterium]
MSTEAMSTIFPDSPAALIVAHPGHEIRLHGWLELVRPQVFVLTDGSGRASRSRLDATTAYLSEYGVKRGGIYGRFTDREVYLALLARDFPIFLRLADELADSFLRDGIGHVSGDATEGYNSTHDVCRLLIDAAVEMASKAGGRAIRNFDFPIVNRPDYCVAGAALPVLRLELDGHQFQRKVSSARKYYPELASEVENTYAGGAAATAGALDDYLARDEAERREHARAGLDMFRIECLRPVVADEESAAVSSRPPFYETHAERLVAAGHYEQVIRYREHLLPLSAALREHVERCV